MLSAFRSLSLRTASNGACLAAPSSSAAFLQFSTASTTETSSTDEDATAAFLDATAPADERSVKTMKKDIRGSPRKLTYLAQQIRGLPAQEAILQMKFSPKRKAAIIQKTVQNAINLADIKYQIEPENLQVAECFVNKGHFLKRLRIMGRGVFLVAIWLPLCLSRGFLCMVLPRADDVVVLFVHHNRPLWYHAPPAHALDRGAARVRPVEEAAQPLFDQEARARDRFCGKDRQAR